MESLLSFLPEPYNNQLFFSITALSNISIATGKRREISILNINGTIHYQIGSEMTLY